MNFDDIFLAVVHGEEVEFKTLNELFAYETCRSVWHLLQTGAIDKNAATRRKLEVQRLFDSAQYLHKQYSEALAKYQDNIRKSKGKLCELEGASIDQPGEVVAQIAVECLAAMVDDDTMERRYARHRKEYYE